MQSREKLSKTTLWMIGLACVLGLCVLALVPAIHVRIKARFLYSSDTDTRQRVGAALQKTGLWGRMALLRAVRSEDYEIAEDAEGNLLQALATDVAAGLDIEPVIRAAIEGINDPGKAGIRCARIASEGWVLGLLDEETKQAVGRRAFEVEIKARPEYLVGKGAPRVYLSKHEMASALAFQYDCRIFLTGQDTVEMIDHKITSVLADEWWNPVLQTPRVGQYALHAKAEVALKKPDAQGLISSWGETIWKTEFETDPVLFRVVEDLPDDHLRATATRKLEQLAQEAVELQVQGGQLDKSFNRLSDTVEVVGTYPFVYLHVYSPLPFDLAFKPGWSAGGKDLADPLQDEGYVILKSGGHVFIKNFPENLASKKLEIFARPGEHVLACKLILEPSLEAALNNPDVEAYWPQPIELPEFTVKVKVTAREESEE